MTKRTLVHIIPEGNCISLRTVSRDGKSPHRFYILREHIFELEHRPEIITRDIRSFAVLRRDIPAGTVEIEFTWLNSNGHDISGREETVTLPYDSLMEFVRSSALESSPAEWKALSLDNSGRHPRLIFKSRENLHAALGTGRIRRKLVRCLRDQFNWPRSEMIYFYNDFVPYSFTFREIRDGQPALAGGLILHGQEDIGKAYYSIHT